MESDKETLVDLIYGVPRTYRCTLRRHDGQTVFRRHTNSGVLDTPKARGRRNPEQILSAYPQLKADRIRAALEYPAQSAEDEIVLTT